MIASDIALLENRAFSESSQKEKLFYLFVTNGDTKSISLGDSLSDQLCHEAFVLGVSESDNLKTLQRSRPLRNIHYSKNLIDLVAAAKIDPDNEADHIKEYLEDHSLREAFIIYLALGIKIPKGIKIESDIDHLIEDLHMHHIYDSAPALFAKLLSQPAHIFDVIVLKNLYLICLNLHPESKNIQSFESLKLISRKLCLVINGIVMIALFLIVSYVAYKYINWYIDNKELHDTLESIILQVFTVILFFAIFLGLNIPDKVKLLDLARNKILTFVYFLVGLKYSDVERILKIDRE